MSRVKAVLFDLDGTLLDTLADLTISINRMLERRGYPARTADEVKHAIGNGAVTLIRRCLPGGAADGVQGCYEEYEEIYKEQMKENTRPYAGILPMMERLARAGVKMAVLSNKPDFAVGPLCAQHFSGMVGLAMGDRPDVPRKPAPDGVMTLLKQMGMSPQETLYVGDSEVDVQTAKNAGMPCVGVSWGFRGRADLEAAGADVVIDAPEELFSAGYEFGA